MNENEIDPTKIIKNFIFNDEVQNILSKINDNVMDFNILEITGMGNQEIKHSNILGWLFDDTEHNLEYQILDSFLKKVIEWHSLEELQSYLYLSNEKRDITIYRERDNIDLLIVDESNKIVIAIENKVYANERKIGKDGGQLKKYENIIKKQYNDEYDKYFLFLTIDLEEPSESNEHWLTCSYQMITETLKEILKVKEITIKTKIVLESYVDLLKRNGIVEDKNLKDLCEKIWANKEYANAIDILMDYRITPMKIIFEQILEKLEEPADAEEAFIDLESIRNLYEKFDKDWKNSEPIFEVKLHYIKGDDKIELEYFYRYLKEQSEEFNKLCKKIIKPKKNRIRENILTISRDDIVDTPRDAIIDKIITKIDEIDEKIKSVVTQYQKQT